MITRSFIFLALLAIVVASPRRAWGQVYEKVFDFEAARAEDYANTGNKAALPFAGLVQGSDGNFYGTTHSGGGSEQGTVFKVTPAGGLTILVEFTGDGALNKGSYPYAGMVQGGDGSFYGTTNGGGGSYLGTVFKMTSDGALTTLVEFTGTVGLSKGSYPYAGLVQGSDGNFYGTTYGGGASDLGTVFRVTSAGVLTTLVEFTGNNGALPAAGLVQGNDGNFYGTTASGGGGIAYGTVFKLTPAGVLTTLVEFTDDGVSNKGRAPRAKLVQGSDGNFYGTTYHGGASDLGTVFKMTTDGMQAGTALVTLAEFTGAGGSNKGRYSNSELVQGSDGNFYGTTLQGGASDFGTVFRVTPTGVLTTLVEFTGTGGSNKGRELYAGLVQGSDGNFYGMTTQGGATDIGTVFKMTPAGMLTTLVEFSGRGTSDTGVSPRGLVQGSDGNFYGTTVQGGASNLGTVFRVTPTGGLTTLIDFTGLEGPNKGGNPEAGLVQGSDGDFYGTGSVVFKMTPAGAQTTLVEFTGTGGSNKGLLPAAELVQGSDGNFYGTTYRGGASDHGTVFKMTPTGVLTTLVEFTNNGASNKGRRPYGKLVQGSDGNFYGTTNEGGASDSGTVFKMTSAGVLATLVEFTDNGASNKGYRPYGGLVQSSDGNFFGTTSEGGAGNLGTVFKVTPAGVLTTLVQFTNNGASNKGRRPYAGLVKDGGGNFYGTTYQGGTGDSGTVFKVTPSGVLTTLVEFTDASNGLPRAELLRAADGNFYGTASDYSAGSIFRLITPGAPSVFSTSALKQGSAEALLEARVNARGAGTTVTLEYGTDGVTFPPANTRIIAINVSGYQTKLVGTALEELAPGTTYFYRFRAESSSGTTVSAVQSFSTLAAPVVAAVAASEVAPGSARFNGTVNARNYSASVIFEWGVDGNSFPNTVAAVPGTVSGNTNVPVSMAVAGLVKGTTYFYRIVASNAGGTTVSGTQSFTTLTDPVAVVGGATAVTSQSARLNGSVNARGALTSVVFEYGTVPGVYPNSVGALPGTVSGDEDTAVSVTLNGLVQGATYYYRVKGTSAGGVGVSLPATLVLDILSGFAQQVPGTVALGDRLGFVFVTLTPGGLGGMGWRFLGEEQWRLSGVPATGLTTGSRVVEFRPVPGFIQPPPEAVDVISGGAAAFVSREYFETESGGTGGVSVTLKPDALAAPEVPVAERAQWRFLGEDDLAWRDSGASAGGLIAGNYVVECKPVAGRTTPPLLNVPVVDGQVSAPVATYFLADALTGTPPVVVPFDTVIGSPALPYQFVGQLRGSAGSSSGFVVKARVVATAGHVVFDDGTLSYTPGLQWLFQRDRGTYEPAPMQDPLLKGFYVFAGYAAQRALENTPGTSSPASQHLDAAAIYFLADAGRGGFGGYLGSDSADNEFLLSSAQKTLVGYPVDGIPAANQGRMHATPPANVAFARVPGEFAPGVPFKTYTTANIRSSGGASGGPLCVQFEGGNYYPAAIYLGGSGQTVVRAIDSQIIELFNRAEVSASGGENNNGGGITQVNSPIGGGGAFSVASLRVTMGPAAVPAGGARWKLGNSGGTQYTSGTQLGALSPGNYTVVFTGVPGFITPANTPTTLTGGVLTSINANYHGITAHPANRTVTSFDDATFSVSVQGTPQSYQWRRNGVNIPAAEGGTTNPYTRFNVPNSSEGEYSVLVTWGNGSVLSNPATLTVNPADQTISFPQPPDRLLGEGSFEPGATATSGLDVTFSLVSGPATRSGSVITPTGFGTVVVRARQDGSNNYNPAPFKDRSIEITGDNLDSWRGQFFTVAELNNPLISGPLADIEGDGLVTLVEFALNLNPKLADRITMQAGTGLGGLPHIVREEVAGVPRLTAEFVRRRAAGVPGITYQMEFTSDLANPTSWSAGGTETTTQIDETWERVKVTDPLPASASRYGRLKITAP